MTRLYRALGADTDERLTNLIALILCAAIPFLYAGAWFAR